MTPLLKIGYPLGLKKNSRNLGFNAQPANGITFAALAPLSGILFRHVMILGMDHDAFQGFENAPHLICWSRRHDDWAIDQCPMTTATLLQAVNAAKDSLYLSYLGRMSR